MQSSAVSFTCATLPKRWRKLLAKEPDAVGAPKHFTSVVDHERGHAKYSALLGLIDDMAALIDNAEFAQPIDSVPAEPAKISGLRMAA